MICVRNRAIRETVSTPEWDVVLIGLVVFYALRKRCMFDGEHVPARRQRRCRNEPQTPCGPSARMTVIHELRILQRLAVEENLVHLVEARRELGNARLRNFPAAHEEHTIGP